MLTHILIFQSLKILLHSHFCFASECYYWMLFQPKIISTTSKKSAESLHLVRLKLSILNTSWLSKTDQQFIMS